MSDETKPDTPNPDKSEEQKPAGDGGTFRRPLIRASLPHPDGAQASQREAPVFTMHEQPPRGNNWGKGGRGGSNGNGNGNVQAKKHGRRRGGHGRNANDQQASGNQANGNQLRLEGRSGSKNRSSRRNRGRPR